MDRFYSLCPVCLEHQTECDYCKENKTRILITLNTDLQALKIRAQNFTLGSDVTNTFEELTQINNKITVLTQSIMILCRLGYRYYEKLYMTSSPTASASGTSIPYDIGPSIIINGCGKCTDRTLCDNCLAHLEN
jgi:hypothetical protein